MWRIPNAGLPLPVARGEVVEADCNLPFARGTRKEVQLEDLAMKRLIDIRSVKKLVADLADIFAA